MCAPSPPPPPDYASAARETAAGDLATARSTTAANRPDIYQPGGSQTWQQGSGFDQSSYDAARQSYLDEYDQWLASGSNPNQMPMAPDRANYVLGDPDKWTGTVNLSPEALKAFQSNERIQSGLGELGEQAIGSVGGLFDSTYQTPGQVNPYSGPEGELGTFGENRQNVMDAMLSRVNTDIDRDRESKRSQLVAQGIPVGSEAYSREMEQLDRQLTDARQQAEIAATQQATQEYGADIAGRGQMGREGMADFTTGLDFQRQQIANALQERQTPLNEISAFRTGSQVQQPSFQPYGQQPFTGGPDLLGAAGAQSAYDMGVYNQQAARSNNLMSGLFSLGSAKIGA